MGEREIRSEISLFVDLLVALDVVANSKVGPAFETHTTFGVLAHLCNVFLDVFEGCNSTCDYESACMRQDENLKEKGVSGMKNGNVPS